MGRPAMSAAATSKHLSSEEKEAKLAVENSLKGGCDKLKPPAYLTAPQKKIFKFILKNLKESKILGNLDTYVLTECSICIDRMQEIERAVNENPRLLHDAPLMSTKEKYTRVFFRCCNELCLSPQSRAKMANINLAAKQNEENPLLKLLMDDD